MGSPPRARGRCSPPSSDWFPTSCRERPSAQPRSRSGLWSAPRSRAGSAPTTSSSPSAPVLVHPHNEIEEPRVDAALHEPVRPQRPVDAGAGAVCDQEYSSVAGELRRGARALLGGHEGVEDVEGMVALLGGPRAQHWIVALQDRIEMTEGPRAENRRLVDDHVATVGVPFDEVRDSRVMRTLVAVLKHLGGADGEARDRQRGCGDPHARAGGGNERSQGERQSRPGGREVTSAEYRRRADGTEERGADWRRERQREYQPRPAAYGPAALRCKTRSHQDGRHGEQQQRRDPG